MSSTPDAAPRLLHTYECIYCHTTAVSSRLADPSLPIRCLCFSWMRWRSSRVAVTDEDKALLGQPVSYTFREGHGVPPVRTALCAWRSCRRNVPVSEMVGPFCSHVCQEADQQDRAAVRARVAALKESNPWIK